MHRGSYQLGWRNGREDFDVGHVGDALASWRSLLPKYRAEAPDLLSYTKGYVRGAFMEPKSAAYEIRRSETWITRRVPRNMSAVSQRDNGDVRVIDRVERIGNVVRHELTVGRARVVFHVDHDKDLIYIASIRVPGTVRRKGEGERAIRHVLALADSLHYDTRLDASPLDKRTSLGRLVRWYQRHGFEMTGQAVNPRGHPRMLRTARDRRRGRKRA